ncbi:MAG: hypothetical protein JO347_10485 [Candidatus Eremiobacteraeota bacterium]|nr:hypothetical protein [Candidatus Eremiobacteraeota bacterium]
MQLLNERCTVDEKIRVASPPSIVLGAIQRFFNVHDNRIELVIPLRTTQKFGTVALEQRIIIEHEAHPNRAIVARYDDRVVVRWKPAEGTGPAFAGRFTIRPHGAGTELHLKGSWVPPGASLEAVLPGAKFDARVAHRTIRELLGHLKGIVETEFRAIADFCRPATALESRARRIGRG